MRRLNLKSIWWLPVAAITLAACGGTDPVDDVLEEMDPPQTEYIEEGEELEGGEGLEVQGEVDENNEEEDMISSITDEEAEEIEEEKGGTVTESAMTELYLLDRNGYVAAQTMNIPRSSNEVQAAVEYLVQGGPVTEMLPNGFQAVLPPGTEVLDSEVSNGVATVDLSEHFAEYHPDQELQVLQALTWTLTQLDDVDRVMLRMNGEELTEMPQNGTPISSGYTRGHGINLETDNVSDLVDTKPVVVYFLSQTDDLQTYYVPVTRRVPNNMDSYEAVVNELLEGPALMSGLLNDFSREVELLDNPQLASNGTLTLNFNEALRSQLEGTAVSQDVLNMLVLSLTEQPDVRDVAIQVESDDTIMVSTGETITEPVSRPTNVNTGEY
ncbi:MULTISPECIES: GerMN domain-containing protein [Bacillaceae]|uniref:GerMN domain-containing protein n=1 Tax=Evansella alkalicola TaxID=745819 RepID=A0ABS6JXY0_9BACI|nr:MULTISPECIES: GerMN domain-containing protein [Bacillaceae]MBU9721965.1 GerMN domain-containing protein [Bacillus alkalicola]